MPTDVLDDVISSMGKIKQTNEMEKSWWMKSSTGKFTINKKLRKVFEKGVS